MVDATEGGPAPSEERRARELVARTEQLCRELCEALRLVHAAEGDGTGDRALLALMRLEEVLAAGRAVREELRGFHERD